MGLLIFYLLTSWMPILMRDAGFSIAKAAMLNALFPLGGGIGTIAAGWLMDRLNPHKVVAATYLLTSVLIFAVGQGVGNVGLLSLLIFLAGTAMNGAQSSMPASTQPTGVPPVWPGCWVSAASAVSVAP